MEGILLAKTFQIKYGWAEGKWLSKRLEAALQSTGFTQTTERQATVLIGHSAGCYLLPKAKSHQLIVIIGVTYWPGKSVVTALGQKIWRDTFSHTYNPWYKLQKIFWNSVYIVCKPQIAMSMWLAVHQSNAPFAITKQSIIIRNAEDPFCTPEIGNLVPNKIFNLPGQHDDCWLNPQPYEELVKSHYAKLLA